jgi:hypothetical protein
MKKEILTACSGVIFAAALAAQPVQAGEKSYVAKANDKGEFCAKVEVRGVAGLPSRKRKCRTIAEWKAAGYDVSTTPVIEFEGKAHVD